VVGLAPDQASYRILVVDDQPENRLLLVKLLTQLGLQVREAANGQGRDDYITKPFQEDVLFHKMAKHLGLRYLYAEQEAFLTPQQALVSQVEVTPLTSASLSVMPLSWVAELHQAARSCDEDTVLSLIAQIPLEHRSLSARLRHLSQNFEFRQIVQLAETYFDQES
jgi:CheY-like chemotaxis protein